MERIVTTCDEENITKTHVQNLLRKPETEGSEGRRTEIPGDLDTAVENLERRMIAEAIQKAGGNKFKAARALGLTRQNLQYKLKRLGLDRASE